MDKNVDERPDDAELEPDDETRSEVDVDLTDTELEDSIELDDEEAGEAEAEGTDRETLDRRSRGVCQSCFLVKHRRQLADPVRSICRDCADPR